MTDLKKISKTSLALKRQETDPLADAAIEAYFPEHKAQLQQEIAGLHSNAGQLSVNAKNELKTLYREILEKAEGLDQTVLRKGQLFFDRNASDIMLLLGLLSLPYCYAAANGAEVLIQSKRILEDPEKRLLETAEFVFNVTDKAAFAEEGKAIPEILKVRLMHAAARWYAKRSGHWMVEELGEPVNQEDMSGTNLAFSLIVIRGLKKLGKSISGQEAFNYINYWNQIGLLLGLDEQLLPKTNKEAYVLERNIRERQFKPSESGRALTKALLKYFEEATIDSPIKGQSNAFVSFLLGEHVSEILGVKSTFLDDAFFQPFRFMYQFQNQLNLKDDSYSKALQQFKEAKESA